MESLKYTAENDYYGAVIYDPFRNLYYRLYHKGHSVHLKNGEIVSSVFDLPWSLLIADEDFNVISKIDFESEKYLRIPIIVLEEGVLIANHYSYGGDKLTMTLFEVNVSEK